MTATAAPVEDRPSSGSSRLLLSEWRRRWAGMILALAEAGKNTSIATDAVKVIHPAPDTVIFPAPVNNSNQSWIDHALVSGLPMMER